LAREYVKDVIIDDTFDTSTQELDMASVKVYRYSLKPNGDFDESPAEIDNSKYKVEQKADGFQLTFNGGITVPYAIKYTTKIKGISQRYYYNTAAVSSDGKLIAELKGQTEFYQYNDTFLVKEREDGSSTTVYPNQVLQWKLSVNDSLSDITNAVLTDVISAGQEYVNDSLKVYKDSSAEPMTTGYTPDISKSEDGKTQIKITFGNISSKYVVKYNTVVTNSSNGAKINNSAAFHGTETSVKTETNKEFTVKVYAGGTGSGDSGLGSITVKKTDADSGNTITSSEAQFKLYYKLNGTERVMEDGARTTKNGEYRFVNLSFGVTYYLEEVSAPTGYVIDKTVKEITLNSGKKDITYSFPDTKVKGNIQFIKLDEKGGYLPGAEFTLYQQSDTEFKNALGSATSDKDGKVIFEKVGYGDYAIRETKAPDKYSLNKTLLYAQVAENGKTVELSSVSNALIKGSIKITKEDSFTGTKLPGATFAVYQKATNVKVMEKSTDSGGIVTFELPYGEYYYKETAAPAGHILASQQKDFNITKEDDRQTFVVKNQPKVTLQITKVDKTQPDRKLQGAKFRVTGPDTNLVVETGPDGTAQVKGLGHGGYTVEEIAPPHGYQLSDNAKQDITVDDKSGEVIPIVFTNLKTRTIVIQKVDAADSNSKLAGAKFEVRTKKGDLIGEYHTDVQGIIEVQDLKFGDYVIKEVSPAPGYQLSSREPQGVSINAGSEEPYKVDFTNEKLRKLTIRKTDSNNPAKMLGGATFSVKGPDGYSAEVTTLENGTASLSGLNFGTYTITETKAPAGYSLNYIPAEVKIDNQKEEFTVEVKNSVYVPLPSSLPDPGGTTATPTPTPAITPTPTPAVIPTPTPSTKPTPTPTTEPVVEVTKEDTPKGGKVPVPDGSTTSPGKEPGNGKVTVDKDGGWNYTPDPGFTGKDDFTVVVTYPDGTTEEIPIHIKVNKVPMGNDPKDSDKNNSGEKGKSHHIPKTGEKIPMAVLPMVITAMVTGIITVAGRKKKSGNSK
jgi:uncharacterized repeat protein (TIGR01451 family)